MEIKTATGALFHFLNSPELLELNQEDYEPHVRVAVSATHEGVEGYAVKVATFRYNKTFFIPPEGVIKLIETTPRGVLSLSMNLVDVPGLTERGRTIL